MPKYVTNLPHTTPFLTLFARRGLPVLLFFCILSLMGGRRAANADNWPATLYDVGLPSHLVAVDKQRQTFLFFEKKSPLRLRYSFPCVTGQVAGDKQALNDLRTPEGIYFVEYKIASGLDFREYGGIAYTLNYPNPVDRLRGKTGHGIWIHSKGFGLVPTRGCVAIGLKDIDTIGPRLTPGTPVVLAGHMVMDNVPRKDPGTARELRRLMHAWSEAWSARSRKMFDFYDQDSYSRGTESFSAFRNNKERLFKMLRFIKIYNREIHVLEGPGYWVTWAEQFYTASNLSTEGVRRLYWQRGADEKFRIVGMEWTPRDVGMLADFQKGRLVAQAVPMVTDASEAPVLPRLDMPEAPLDEALSSPPLQPEREAAQGAGEGIRQVAASTPLVPRAQPSPQPDEVNWGASSLKEMPESSGVPAAENGQGNAENPESPDATEVAPVDIPSDDGLTTETKNILEQNASAFNEALSTRTESIWELFDVGQYNRLPGIPKGSPYAAVSRDLNKYLKAPWITVISHPPAISREGAAFASRSRQLVVSPQGMEEGIRELMWNRGADGIFRIVGASFKPSEFGLVADYLEEVSTRVSEDLEAWRKAWMAADIDAYMAFYTDDAYQQGRRGAKIIRSQKAGLWSRAKPVKVRLSGIRLVADKKGIHADMTQSYADSLGRKDQGLKTLLLRFDGTHWRIAREDWTALPSH